MVPHHFLLEEKFEYEDLHTAMFMFERGDCLVTFDLKSEYHHVDVHKEHCAYMYLGFELGMDFRRQKKHLQSSRFP